MLERVSIRRGFLYFSTTDFRVGESVYYALDHKSELIVRKIYADQLLCKNKRTNIHELYRPIELDKMNTRTFINLEIGDKVSYN